MITLAQCAALAGLAADEIVSDATPSAKHHSLLSSYRLNMRRGAVVVRDMIVANLRTFLDLGASHYAADLLLVLRLFLSDYPDAKQLPRGYLQVDAVLNFVRDQRASNLNRLSSRPISDRAVEIVSAVDVHPLGRDRSNRPRRQPMQRPVKCIEQSCPTLHSK